MLRKSLLAVSCYMAAACATEPGASAGPLGAWSFAASWGDSANPCTMTGTTLTLSHTGGEWTGSLKGGDAHCDGIPGEAPVLQNPPDAVLDSIRVVGDSIRFTVDSGTSVFRGRFTDTSMEGALEIFTFCQCTGPQFTGTWRATLP